MSETNAEQAELLRLTGSSNLAEALEWISEENPLREEIEPHRLLYLIRQASDGSQAAKDATHSIVRKLAESDLDSASFLLDVDSISRPERFDRSLALLAGQCSSGGLDSINEKALISAQRRDPFVIEALCSLVGLSYNELTQRVEGLPASCKGHFGPSQLRAAFAEIDRIVCQPGETPIEGAVPVAPLELLVHPRPSWAAIEEMRVNGVSLGHLLAQREVGGAWLSHRNRTANQIGPILAQRLCDQLDSRSIEYERSSLLGGTAKPTALANTAGCDRQIGVLVKLEDSTPVHGVVFSIARDGGTARANGNRLINMNQGNTVPLSIVVAGPGWTSRHETVDLASAFGDRIYTDRTLSELASNIESEIKMKGDVSASSE